MTVETDSFVTRLENASDQIEQVRVVASDVLQVSHDDEYGGPEVLYEALREALGSDAVDIVDVYGEYPETIPSTTE